jgi:hypothetical protein
MRYVSFGLVFLMVVSLFFPSLLVVGEPGKIPHEDPAVATSNLDVFALLSNYVDILTLLSQSNYDNASMLMDDLSFITVPDDLRYIIDRYNELIQQLMDLIESLDFQLNEAERLLDQLRVDEASEILDNVAILVTKAELLIKDVEDATSVMAQNLGVFSAASELGLTEIYSRLQEVIQRLNDLIAENHELLLNLRGDVQNIESLNLKRTELSLSLNTTRLFVGESCLASGRLVSEGENLSNRVVMLFLDNENVADSLTDENGAFFATIAIPYNYVDNVNVSAVFVPVGDDRLIYFGSSSPVVVVDVLFFETLLDVSLPSDVFPGLGFTVNGRVVSDSGMGLDGRFVSFYSDSNLVGQVQTGQNGEFFYESIVGSDLLGLFSFGIKVDSDGVYDGVFQEYVVFVKRFATIVEVDVPSYVIIPSGVFVEGYVRSVNGDSLDDALVTLEFSNNSVAVKSFGGGKFNGTVYMPLNLVFVGYQELSVSVDPVEPWQDSFVKRTSVFVVNPFNIGLLSTAFISVGIVFYSRISASRSKARKMKKENKQVNDDKEESIKMDIEDFSLLPSRNYSGIKGRIAKAYVRALRSVESYVGVSLSSEMSLREFLLIVEPKLSKASLYFGELTFLVERIMYSEYRPHKKKAGDAELWADNVVRFVRDGIA